MTSLDDRTLAELGHRNRVEYGRLMARWSGTAGRLVEQDGVLLHAAASDFPVFFNGAFRLEREVPADRVIDQADEFFGALGRGYSLSLRDGDPDDADLFAAAEAKGLVSLTSEPEMVVRGPVSERAVPDGVALRWVDDGAPVADFVEVADLAYVSLGMAPGAIRAAFVALEQIAAPDVRTVVAYLDGEPVAAAQTVLSHGIAGVYCVGTIESARGRGLADLVTRAVTNRAFDEGARANTLQASSMGESIYTRMGYATIYRYTGWTRLTPNV